MLEVLSVGSKLTNTCFSEVIVLILYNNSGTMGIHK